MDDRERLFFEHDLAAPLSNLKGAEYLLRGAPGEPDERTLDALEILSHSIHHLERMLSWYWKTQELRGKVEPVEPWPVSGLPGRLESRIDEEGTPLNKPEVQGALRGWAEAPPDLLVMGLLGAGGTLAAASGASPQWGISAARGVLKCRYTVPGDRLALDPSSLFRKYYWPAPSPAASTLDSGFPLLEAILEPFGGGLEMAWEPDRWLLLATLPLIVRPVGKG